LNPETYWSQGSSYSENELPTTSVSNTTGMSIDISIGPFQDKGHEYAVTSRVYYHSELGCLS
jgi:hypothetical protein